MAPNLKARPTAVVAVVLACVALGAVSVLTGDSPWVLGPRASGIWILVAVSAVAAFMLRGGGRVAKATVGPGFLFAVLAFAFAFVLGLISRRADASYDEDTVSLLLACGVSAFLVGGLIASTAVQRDVPNWPKKTQRMPFGQPVLRLTMGILVAVAAINLITGDIPLVSANIDETRFTGDSGALGSAWSVVIGGMEWGVLVAAISLIVGGSPKRASRVVMFFGLFVLVLLAGRSFLLVIALAVAVSVGTMRSVSLVRVGVLACVGITLLSVAGSLRIAESDPTGERRQYLEANGLGGFMGPAVLSASTGPYVLGQVDQTIPSVLPFQRGHFLIRDLEAQIPFLESTERSDIWVTSEVLFRNPDVIGGSPPTLVGGLYIDFGLVGVIFGSALMGAVLVAMYGWVRNARTIGAVAFYAYASAFVMVTAYSYFSIKPIALTALLFCYLTHRVELDRHSWNRT